MSTKSEQTHYAGMTQDGLQIEKTIEGEREVPPHTHVAPT